MTALQPGVGRADEPPVEPNPRTPCTGCGHLVRREESWCSLCHEPAADPRFRVGGAFSPTARADDHSGPPAAPLRSWRHSRWAGTEVSFGPAGRVVCTVVLLALVYPAFQSGPLGGIAYTVFLMPWALRDVWRRVRLHR